MTTVPYSHELNWPPHLRPFDPLDEEIQADPYPHYAWMRENAPVLRTKTTSGDVWLVSRFQDVQWALRSPKLFSSEVGYKEHIPQMFFMDPPAQTRLREVVASEFTPKAVARHEAAIQALVDEHFGRYLKKGGGEIVEECIAQLTIGTIASVLGLPLTDAGKFRTWSSDVANYFGRVTGRGLGDPPADELGMKAFLQYVQKAMTGTDEEGSILARIGRLFREGVLPEKEAQFLVLSIFNAGHETTTMLTANGMIILAQRPDLLRRLRDKPADVTPFVEELARYRPSAHRLSRITTTDVAIGGVTIPAQSAVRLLPAAANRDSARYPNGEVFDMDRDTSGHMAFGFGIHSCLGSWLARLESKVLFRTVSQRLSRLEFDPDLARSVVPYKGGTLGPSGPQAVTLKVFPA
jgi:cytochrome P450